MAHPGQVLGTLALVAIYLTAGQVWAADPPPARMEDAPAPSDAKEWYGAPIVVTDLASLALFVGGMVAADHGSKAGSGLLIAGAGTYLLGGPTVHVVQRRARTGVASLVLRGVAPLGVGLAGAIVGAAVGSQMDCGDKENCGIGGLAIGFVVGFAGGGVAAMVVDDASLARREITPRSPAVAIIPTYQPTSRQAGFALRATW